MAENPPEPPPPNGLYRLNRRILMFVSSGLLLGWWGAWAAELTNREPTFFGTAVLLMLAVSSKKEGDEFLKAISQAVIDRLGSKP